MIIGCETKSKIERRPETLQEVTVLKLASRAYDSMFFLRLQDTNEKKNDLVLVSCSSITKSDHRLNASFREMDRDAGSADSIGGPS